MNFAAFHTAQPTTALRLLTIVMKQLLSSQPNLAAAFRQSQTVVSDPALLAVASGGVVAVAVCALRGSARMEARGRTENRPRLRPTRRHGRTMRRLHVRRVTVRLRHVRDMYGARARMRCSDGDVRAMPEDVPLVPLGFGRARSLWAAAAAKRARHLRRRRRGTCGSRRTHAGTR